MSTPLDASRDRSPDVYHSPEEIAALVAEAAESFDAIDDADLGPLLDRIGDAEVVLLGEANHGTSEFYRMRQRITRRLIEEKGFTVEADWTDAEWVDEYVRGRTVRGERPWEAFARWRGLARPTSRSAPPLPPPRRLTRTGRSLQCPVLESARPATNGSCLLGACRLPSEMRQKGAEIEGY